MGPFEQHLDEAIALNRARRDYYAQISEGRSRWVSWWLIGSEKFLRRTARRLDQRALPFNAAGIPIMIQDVVSMEDVAPQERLPRYRRQVTRVELRLAKEVLRSVVEQSASALRKHDYDTVVGATAHALHQIEALESQCQAHFAMSIHLLESVGLAALHSRQYVQQSQEIKPLCRDLVLAQVGALSAGPRLDRLAQAAHEKGAGIIYNDVPPIPFLQEFERGHS